MDNTLASLTINCILSTAGMYLRDIDETDEVIIQTLEAQGWSKENAVIHLKQLAELANTIAETLTGPLCPAPTARTAIYIRRMIAMGIELDSAISACWYFED